MHSSQMALARESLVQLLPAATALPPSTPPDWTGMARQPARVLASNRTKAADRSSAVVVDRDMAVIRTTVLTRNVRCLRSVRRFDLAGKGTGQSSVRIFGSPQSMEGSPRKADYHDMNRLRDCFRNPSGSSKLWIDLAITSNNRARAELRFVRAEGSARW